MPLMEPMFGFARYVWKFFVPLAVLAILLLGAYYYFDSVILLVASGVVAILGAYILYFFRDPERRITNIPNSIASPADGRVASVIEMACPEMPGGRARSIAIFLNVFNVHVQRSPIDGKVTKVDRREGKCMNALNEKCSEENEAYTVWLKTDFGPIGVRQLSGAIARRIICLAKPGDDLERGDRYGIIQFGSRVEVFLPLDATVKVQPGKKVAGGETCLAVLFEEEVRRGSRDRRPSDEVETGAI